MKNIEKAIFVESNIRGQRGLEHFVVSINGENKNIWLIRHHADPETGKSTGPRDLEPEQTLIETFNPDDLVNLTVKEYHWRIENRSGTKYYLVSITRSYDAAA